MRGGQWQVLYLLRGLRDAGVETLLLARRGSPLFERASIEGLAVGGVSPASVIREGRKADLVHVHDARSHTLALGLRGSCVVVSRRVAFPVKRTLLSKFKYAFPRRYIAVSQFVRDGLLDAGIPGDKITVIPDGAAVPPQEARGDCIVSPLFRDPAKGTDLVRAAAQLAGVNVTYSEDLMADLARARLFVYITYSEGLGSAAIQAMAAGVPVVASRVGGLTEVVEDGVTGLLVENRAEQIAAAMNAILQNPSMAASFREQGRLRFERLFTLPIVVAKTIEVYKEVIACGRS
jgi:hypothetical protein